MKSLKVYLIVAGILLTLYIVAQLNRPKMVDWSPTFVNTEKSPFGTYVLFNRLKDIFPGTTVTSYRQPVYNVMVEDSLSNSSYIIISNNISLSKADFEQLTGYVKKGNDVFIASEAFGGALEKNLHVETKYMVGFGKNDKAVKFLNPNLDTARQYQVDKGAGNIFFSRFDTTRAVVAGENNDHNTNFIMFRFGKGWLYLASNPKMFSNYSLLKPQGAAYAATALSFIKNTRHIAFDEYYTQGPDGEASLMRVFLTRPMLQWAYYITIFSLLAFVLYEIKRRQRIIPVIEPLKNATLDFVTVVGHVYFEKHDNANIAQKTIAYFMARLRDDYQLKTDKLDDEFKDKLVAKTGVNRTDINDLVAFISYLNVQSKVTDRELIILNKMIEKISNQAR